ncbi:MAG: hypothetical protein EU551_02915 [Promethearchaeota archaeon]|nr:MAG: hypothetical protein EU551_02915 [Candidatus Lokiarchaeota archaeon]
MSDNNEDELHFKVKDLGIGTFLPLHFLISLLPIYPVFYLFYLYLHFFNFNLQLALIFLPLVIMGLLILYVGGVVYLTKFILIISHWRSKPTEGINMERDFDSKLVFHYHLRGFVKKFPLWLILRSPFPFLIKWMFNTFGLYKISKNVVLYDSWIGLEYIYLDGNSVVGLGTVLSSHLVDGMNRLTIKRIHLRKNAQLGHNVLLAPGVIVGKNSIVRSNAGVPKLIKLKKNSVFKSGFYNALYMKDIKGTGELRKRLGLRK